MERRMYDLNPQPVSGLVRREFGDLEPAVQAVRKVLRDTTDCVSDLSGRADGGHKFSQRDTHARLIHLSNHAVWCFITNHHRYAKSLSLVSRRHSESGFFKLR
jgi:hypothetical protein